MTAAACMSFWRADWGWQMKNTRNGHSIGYPAKTIAGRDLSLAAIHGRRQHPQMFLAP